MASQRRTVSSAKSGKVVQRLKQRIEEGKFYEAHQTYKVLYQRYCAQGKMTTAKDLLFEGASTLLRHSQWESGTDLAMMFTRHLKQEQAPVTKELLGMINELFSLYSGPREYTVDIPAQLNVKVEVDPREHFMRSALKWSSIVEEGKYKYGHPSLHHLLGITFLEEKQFGKAREHFLYAGDPESFAVLLVEMAGPEGGGADVIITGAVLQLLVLRDLQTASATFTAYLGRHSLFCDLPGPPYSNFPLLSFVHSLLQACPQGDVDAYKRLREKYDTLVTGLDPTYSYYLDKIGVAYFGQPASASSGEGQASNGIGGAGLMGLFGGGGAGRGLLENLIGTISNSIPDPPFLQDDLMPPGLDLGAMVNGEAVHQPADPVVPERILLLTTDDDTLD